MKTFLLAVSMVLFAAACGGGQGDSGEPCGNNGAGTCLSSCSTALGSGSCGLGLTCCAPTE
jgi:hypothetical protein